MRRSGAIRDSGYDEERTNFRNGALLVPTY